MVNQIPMKYFNPHTSLFCFFGVITILFILTVLSINIHSQENATLYGLGQRVGNEIDRQERDYFCLFPDLVDFYTARAFQLPNDSIKIEIKLVNQFTQSDTTLIIDKQEIQNFVKYLNDFEQIFINHEKYNLLKVNPKLLNLYAAQRKIGSILKKYNEGEFTRFNIFDSESRQYSGLVLYANDSLVFLWNSSTFYDWRKTTDNLYLLHNYEIRKIIIERDGNFLSGVGTGFLIGGGIGALVGLASGDDSEGIIRFSAGTKALFGGLALGTTFGLIGGIWGAAQGTDDELNINCDEILYKKSINILKDNAFFPIHAPPEIFNYLQNVKLKNIQHSSGKKEDKGLENYEHGPKPINEEKSNSITSDSDDNNTKVHISFMANYTNIRANNDIIDALEQSGFGGNVDNWLFGGSVDYPVDHSNIFTWHIESSYSFYNNYRFGLGVKKIAPQEIRGTNGVSEFTEGYSYNLFADWIVDPYELHQLDRWEHMIGIGLTHNRVTINRSVGYFTNEESILQNIYGLQLRGGVDYYPSPSLSFQIKLVIDVVPSINVDEFKSTEVEEVLKQHSINFSGIDVSVGLRIHL